MDSRDVLFESQPMLTYLGNKRKLLGQITSCVERIRAQVGKEKLNILDAFSGSGVVARAMAPFANELHANDWELYSYVQAQCFVVKPTENEQKHISDLIGRMNALEFTEEGIMCQHYAPKDSQDIKMGERCFFTRENALIIDTMRKFIVQQPEKLQPYLLAPLLIKASVHTNTSGQFQAFHKNRAGLGAWGGEFAKCLPRIKGEIKLDVPVFSKNDYNGYAYKLDVCSCLKRFADGHLDIIYLDPPYNHRQYSYLYFLLNIIAENKMPAVVTDGAGATDPKLRNNSDFCNKKKVVETFNQLLRLCTEKSKYTILSYSNESMVKPEEMQKLLAPYEVSFSVHGHSRYNVRGDERERDAVKNTEEFLYVISKREAKGLKREREE
jgi:adenine-specific DNA-methyltransferase